MQTGDHRSVTEHDCDRILYSDAFRRLGGVTQVVAVGEKPLFHTRLTHTLKVAQISRRLAEHLNREPRAADMMPPEGIDSAAAEAAGLAHDLGHPPFGHIGEKALSAKCTETGLDGYEGNAQTVRILVKLSRRGDPESHGLGISDRTLGAVMKYPWLREGEHASDKKWNAYPTEREAFVRARGSRLNEVPSVEASLMDWADDITYAVHDLEDFFRAGLIPLARLLEDRFEMATFTAAAAARLAEKREQLDMAEATDAFQDVLPLAFRNARHYRGSERDLLNLQKASRFLINRYVSGVSLQTGEQPLRVPRAHRQEVALLKQLTWHYVIDDPALATLQQGHVKIIEELFDSLVKWLKKADEKPAESYRLPVRLRELYKLTEDEQGSGAYPSVNAQRGRAAADFISSLTEDQAIDLHERLNGAARHSVLDPWLAY